VLRHQKKYVEAEAMFRQTIEVEQRIHGKDHTPKMNAEYWVAKMLANQERYEEAEVIYKRVLEVYESTLGKEHEKTQDTCFQLAEALNHRKKYAEARPCTGKSTNSNRRAWGKIIYSR
jgi:TolA-binding protein